MHRALKFQVKQKMSSVLVTRSYRRVVCRRWWSAGVNCDPGGRFPSWLSPSSYTFRPLAGWLSVDLAKLLRESRHHRHCPGERMFRSSAASLVLRNSEIPRRLLRAWTRVRRPKSQTVAMIGESSFISLWLCFLLHKRVNKRTCIRPFC